MQETWDRFLALEDLLEKEMATHSSILPWRIPMDRGAWQAAVHGVTRVRHDLANKQQQQDRQYEDLTSHDVLKPATGFL